jgi:hypothetical protein
MDQIELQKLFLDDSHKIYKPHHFPKENPIFNIVIQHFFKFTETDIIIDFRFFKSIAGNDNYDEITRVYLLYMEPFWNKCMEENRLYNVYFNMRGLTLTELEKNYNFFKNLNTLLTEQFPNKLKTIFIYNAPFVYAQLFSFISRILDPETREKLQLVHF